MPFSISLCKLVVVLLTHEQDGDVRDGQAEQEEVGGCPHALVPERCERVSRRAILSPYLAMTRHTMVLPRVPVIPMAR